MYTLVQLKSKYHLSTRRRFVENGVHSNGPLRGIERGAIDKDGHIIGRSEFTMIAPSINYAYDDSSYGDLPYLNHRNNIVVVYHNTTNIPEVFKNPDYLITDDENDKDPRSIYLPISNQRIGNLWELIQERRMLNHNLDKTQIKLLLNYDMEHVLVALDKGFTARSVDKKNDEGKTEFLANKVRELDEMLANFQAQFSKKATI